MNIYELDIIRELFDSPYVNQRELSQRCGCSLGIINQSINNLVRDGCLDSAMQLSAAIKDEVNLSSPRNAIILAAGFGMRMVPINSEQSKAFLEINGEPLIERIINQLHEVGIRRISIVVGFLRESFEYLIDKYDVELIVNKEYGQKNNLHSLWLASHLLSNSYVIPCDIWCRENPFRKTETYSWYMVSDTLTQDSYARVGRRFDLIPISNGKQGNAMIGICYLKEQEAQIIRDRICRFHDDYNYDKAFWETALFDKDYCLVRARLVSSNDAVEINTYEQLRDFDCDSNQLKSDIIGIISGALDVVESDIRDISVLKKGMTNRSFLFSCGNKKYIMRIPGEGTEKLIKREEEANVYKAVSAYGLCDPVIYINSENGYKITEFLEQSHTCDSKNPEEVRACMKKLRQFHELSLSVKHTFDIFDQINFYESLWEGAPSAYRDYEKIKKAVFSLRSFLEMYAAPAVLTHIDAVPDNFLIETQDDGERKIRLIDWEYAGMQDPHVDIAMFCIYALYDRDQIDETIDMYFDDGCPDTVRLKIYGYIAACGLLWSNWCEYKRLLGVEFGEYSLKQYRYAKVFSKIINENREKTEV